jgi:hypothetical protein
MITFYAKENEIKNARLSRIVRDKIRPGNIITFFGE